MLSEFNSKKIKFWSFVSMALLVFVHGYNLNESYLQPWTLPGEPLTPTSFVEYWLANGLFRFRIPMLFVISGYLFALNDNQAYGKRIIKRIKTLLFPYLFWSALALLFTYFLESFLQTRNIVEASNLLHIDRNLKLLHQYSWLDVLGTWIFFPVAYQLWFIRVLFIYNLSYPLLKYCVTNKVASWIFFAFAILFWISTGGVIFIEGEGLLFFSLGIWMQKTAFNINESGKWLSVNFWLPCFIVLSIAKTFLAFQPHFNGIEFILLIAHKLVVISGLIIAWYASNKLVNFFMYQAWFVWISAFSFMIYVMHAPAVVYAMKAIFLYTPHFYAFRITTFFVLPLLLIAIAIGTGALLRGYLPKIYHFMTGGRGFN